MEIRHEEDDIVQLYNASMSGCTTTLYRLMRKEPNILNKISLTSLSETPLHVSTLAGHLDFSRALLLLKPQLAVELDSHRRCPLHMASAEGYIEIVQTLLHANNNACFIHDQYGRIPLHYAVVRGRIEVVSKLIVARPDSTLVVLDEGETILHLCVKYKQLEVLKLLVESMSDEGDFFKSKDHKGCNTILHLAVMLKQVETIKYLLSVPKVKGVDNVLNQTGYTALQLLGQYPIKGFTIQNIFINDGVEKAEDPTTTVGRHESVKLKLSLQKWWSKLLECLRHKGDWLEDTRGSLMMVATVITTIAYQPALSPPGGVWQTNANDSGQGSACSPYNTCEAGTLLLAYAYEDEYLYFVVVCNTIAFTASQSVIFSLISGFPHKNKVFMGLLTFSMCITLTFLAISYAPAYALLVPCNLYLKIGLKVLILVGVFLCSIAVVVLFHALRFLHWLVSRIRKFIPTRA